MFCIVMEQKTAAAAIPLDWGLYDGGELSIIAKAASCCRCRQLLAFLIRIGCSGNPRKNTNALGVGRTRHAAKRRGQADQK